MQAAPHVTETADKAGEAIQQAAHTVAENAEPAVNQATFVIEKKVGQHRIRWCKRKGRAWRIVAVDEPC